MPITFWAKVLGSFFLEPHFESGAGCWAGLGWVEGLGWPGLGWAGGLIFPHAT